MLHACWKGKIPIFTVFGLTKDLYSSIYIYYTNPLFDISYRIEK
jgi:hypothetical protein